MNIRKNIDYSGLYAEIDKVLAAGLSQMELYLELGRLVSGRPEKGAAVMAAEYIIASYPERTGFSPRNLRRMREFYRMYESHPEVLEQAMKVGWTQNIVILEADLDMDARLWYLRAAQRFGWSKTELTKQIIRNVNLEVANEESISISECDDTFSKPSTMTNVVPKIAVQAVDFLSKFWYNNFYQALVFRLLEDRSKAYG